MASSTRRPVVVSLQGYGRGVAGGLLFSLPLLYTMEMWWTGFLVGPGTLLVCVGVTFLLLLGYNRFGGMRPEAGWSHVAIESVEELGIALVVAATVLYLLGQIRYGMPPGEVLGKVILEAMVVAIGVSIGTAQLGESKERDKEEEDGHSSDDDPAPESARDAERRSPLVAQLVLALCGAVVFAANVAPTEEIVIVAIEASAGMLLAIVAASLLLGALILHYSSFHGAHRTLTRNGLAFTMLEPVVCYVVALAASAMLLWLFQRFDDVSLAVAVRETVVLAFAGNLGAAAGRLLIQ